jgi:SAM-dependent methyltransferase
VLELGCGTGRVTVPLARTGGFIVGIDRAAGMLGRAAPRLRQVGRAAAGRLVRGDITALPFPSASFAGVVAPYGILQSLLSDRALAATLAAVGRILAPGGRFGLELVPDVPRWQENRRQVSLVGLQGPNGRPVTLVESVRQDRARRITTFDHEFIEGTGTARRRLRFTVQFRTLGVRAMAARLARAGLRADGIFGGYANEPWSRDAGAWIILARKGAGR